MRATIVGSSLAVPLKARNPVLNGVKALFASRVAGLDWYVADGYSCGGRDCGSRRDGRDGSEERCLGAGAVFEAAQELAGTQTGATEVVRVQQFVRECGARRTHAVLTEHDLHTAHRTPHYRLARQCYFSE